MFLLQKPVYSYVKLYRKESFYVCRFSQRVYNPQDKLKLYSYKEWENHCF